MVGGGAQVDGVELVALAELQHLGRVAKDEHDASPRVLSLSILARARSTVKTFRRTPWGLASLRAPFFDVIVGGSVVDDDDALGLNLGGPGKDDLAVQQTVVKTCEDDLGGTGAVTGRLGFLGGSRGGLDRCVGVGQTGAGSLMRAASSAPLTGTGLIASVSANGMLKPLTTVNFVPFLESSTMLLLTELPSISVST